jgi:hypothetical protein
MQTDAIHLPAIPAADLESPPLAQADTIPSRWYWDPAFDRLDRDAVFARTWQGVGHARCAAKGSSSARRSRETRSS